MSGGTVLDHARHEVYLLIGDEYVDAESEPKIDALIFHAKQDVLMKLLYEVAAVNAKTRKLEQILTEAGRGHDAAYQAIEKRLGQILKDIEP